ncbi:hypothetical protein BGW38_002657, partial [Lunasporangiospora selenospora]
MELSRCGLYCNQCKDFIFDRDFDALHNGEVLRNSEIISMVQEPGQKRPRYVKWYAGTKESALIRSGTKLKPCQVISTALKDVKKKANAWDVRWISSSLSFLHTMWMSSSDLAGYAQQDAHEFFISALNQIHAKSPLAKAHYCNCVIHKTFAGILQSDVTCLNCANVTSAFDPILDISLDLRPTKRSKSGVNKVRGIHDEKNDGPNSLTDCLD